VQNWYTCRSEQALAMQVVKYAQRDGWSHRDVLRLAKPVGKTASPTRDAIFRYATKGEVSEAAPELLRVVSTLGTLTEKSLLKAIEEHNLPMEVIPTDKRTAAVYEAMLPSSGLTWLFRNLGNLGKSGVLRPLSLSTAAVCARLTDEEALKAGRIHPLQCLIALNTYKSGRGVRGSGGWDVVGDVVDALDCAFYAAFDAVKPSGARTVLALDVSGSMAWGDVAGMPGITPRVGSAAMAMVTLKAEPSCVVTAFSTSMVKVDLSRQKRLDDVCTKLGLLTYGGTDCALPMLWALKNKVEADAFVVYTDSETWAGDIHPCQALQKYRNETGINAKLVVVGMVSNGFSIADPSDGGMLDVVGFDTAAPNVIADFCRPQ
jgi:60 kDa SS-A/Ro ribonucleoprotein